MPSDRTRVVLACSGLDHARRGFESFARECFDELREDPRLQVELLKGSGPARPGERALPTLTRDAVAARALGRALRREPFRFEQVAFGLSLQPALAARRPDVVYFSEWHTGLVLAALRRVLRQRFALVLCNGTMAQSGFGHLDRVQELTPAALETVLARGDDPRRHVLLPLGFAIAPALRPVAAEERRALRDRFGLPADRPVLLSVAALNRHHKRLDYLVEEVARLPAPAPFVVLAGQPEAETPGIRALAERRLGPDGYRMLTVAPEEVTLLQRASDAFVLASLGEGLPRALVEAMAQGLPCLLHDYGVTRYVAGDHGSFGDFSQAGGLARLIAGGWDGSDAAARRRHRHVHEHFGWAPLRERYVELLRGAAGGGPG